MNKKSPKGSATAEAPVPAQFHTIDEVAQYLAVSPRTVRRWIDAKRLAAIRIGTTIRISDVSIKFLIEAGGDK